MLSLITLSSVQGQADSTISKVDSILNQAIKDGINADMRLGIIAEKNIQLSVKDGLLNQMRSKYYDCIRGSDSKDIQINFLKSEVKNKGHTIKILIYVDIGVILGTATYLYYRHR